MKKRLLSKIPIEAAADNYIKLALENKDNDKSYIISAMKITDKENEYLLMNFYFIPELLKGNKQIKFRTLLSHDDYITQEIKNKTEWRTGILQSIMSCYYWGVWWNKCILADGALQIKAFLKAKGNDLLKYIDNLQHEILADRLASKHKVIIKRIDKEMRKVPSLPEDFMKWIDDTALFTSRYIYYTYKLRKKLEGYCTHCKSNVIVESPKHNQPGVCPNCGSPIVYKAMGKSRNVEDYRQAAVIQKHKDDLIIRYFSIHKDYRRDFKKPLITIFERTRDFYYSANTQNCFMGSYEWAEFKQTGKTRWCDSQGKYYFSDAALYEKNIDEVLKDTIWKYSAIKLYATHEKGFQFNIYTYLKLYKDYPALEYFVKLKLYKLVRECCSGNTYWLENRGVNLKGKKLNDVLNVNKSQLIVAQRINAGACELETIRKAGRAKLNLTDDQILLFSNIGIEAATSLGKYANTNKVAKYIKSKANKDEDFHEVYRDWKDYLQNCETLKYDLKNEFVLFPKNLKKAHDEVCQLVEKNNSELLNKQISLISEKLNEVFNWKYKNYIIRLPKNADEIIKEGQDQHHCVGTYVKRVAAGKSIILFLRKKDKPDKSYYTIEANPETYEILQCRCKFNGGKTEAVSKLLDRYSLEKLQPMFYEKAM